MQPQLLSGNIATREHPHDTGMRRMPWALIQFVDNGPYCAELQDQRITLRAGEIWILPPRMPNRVFAPRPGVTVHTGWLHFRCQLDDGSDLFDHWQFPQQLNGKRAAGLMTSIRDLLYWHRRAGDSLPDQVRFEKRKYLLLERLFAVGQPIDSAHRPHQRDLQSLLLRINQNLDQHWNRKRMATELGLSESRFHDVFQAATGQAPAGWLRQRRLDHARHLLVHSTMQIQDIAADCGFDDPYHFSRVFKQAEHCSPRLWRQQHRNNE